MVSALSLFATVGVVMAATTIGTNVTTGGSIYATSTLYVTGVSFFDGNMVLATASSTGTVKLAGVDSDSAGISFNSVNFTSVGDIAFGTASSTGTVKLAGVDSDSAGISFNSVNFTSVGDIAFGTASSTGIFKSAQIQSTTGNISFNDDNLSTTGTLAAGNTVITGLLTASTNVGAASTSPLMQLGIGTGQATSTISMGKFCMFAEQENGVAVYIRLSAFALADQPFATSTTPCNQ